MMRQLNLRNFVQDTEIRSRVHDLELYNILADLKKFCDLLNCDLESFRLAPAAFQECLISVCYRLLRLYPLRDQRPESRNDSAMQLGLLAFMITSLFKNGQLQTLQ